MKPFIYTTNSHKLLNLLSAHGELSAQEIYKAMFVSERQTRRLLNLLLEIGLVKTHGWGSKRRYILAANLETSICLKVSVKLSDIFQLQSPFLLAHKHQLIQKVSEILAEEKPEGL